MVRFELTNTEVAALPLKPFGHTHNKLVGRDSNSQPPASQASTLSQLSYLPHKGKSAPGRTRTYKLLTETGATTPRATSCPTDACAPISFFISQGENGDPKHTLSNTPTWIRTRDHLCKRQAL